MEFNSWLDLHSPRWVARCRVTSLLDRMDIIIREQFLPKCVPEVREWVIEHKPRMHQTTAMMADEFVTMRPQLEKWVLTPDPVPATTPPNVADPPKATKLGWNKWSAGGAAAKACRVCQ
ncbi:hypothetical protein FKM82_018753 [Ascaphus truei]